MNEQTVIWEGGDIVTAPVPQHELRRRRRGAWQLLTVLICSAAAFVGAWLGIPAPRLATPMRNLSIVAHVANSRDATLLARVIQDASARGRHNLTSLDYTSLAPFTALEALSRLPSVEVRRRSENPDALSLLRAVPANDLVLLWNPQARYDLEETRKCAVQAAEAGKEVVAIVSPAEARPRVSILNYPQAGPSTSNRPRTIDIAFALLDRVDAADKQIVIESLSSDSAGSSAVKTIATLNEIEDGTGVWSTSWPDGTDRPSLLRARLVVDHSTLASDVHLVEQRQPRILFFTNEWFYAYKEGVRLKDYDAPRPQSPLYGYLQKAKPKGWLNAASMYDDGVWWVTPATPLVDNDLIKADLVVLDFSFSNQAAEQAALLELPSTLQFQPHSKWDDFAARLRGYVQAGGRVLILGGSRVCWNAHSLEADGISALAALVPEASSDGPWTPHPPARLLLAFENTRRMFDATTIGGCLQSIPALRLSSEPLSTSDAVGAPHSQAGAEAFDASHFTYAFGAVLASMVGQPEGKDSPHRTPNRLPAYDQVIKALSPGLLARKPRMDREFSAAVGRSLVHSKTEFCCLALTALGARLAHPELGVEVQGLPNYTFKHTSENFESSPQVLREDDTRQNWLMTALADSSKRKPKNLSDFGPFADGISAAVLKQHVAVMKSENPLLALALVHDPSETNYSYIADDVVCTATSTLAADLEGSLILEFDKLITVRHTEPYLALPVAGPPVQYSLHAAKGQFESLLLRRLVQKLWNLPRHGTPTYAIADEDALGRESVELRDWLEVLAHYVRVLAPTSVSPPDTWRRHLKLNCSDRRPLLVSRDVGKGRVYLGLWEPHVEFELESILQGKFLDIVDDYRVRPDGKVWKLQANGATLELFKYNSREGIAVGTATSETFTEVGSTLLGFDSANRNLLTSLPKVPRFANYAEYRTWSRGNAVPDYLREEPLYLAIQVQVGNQDETFLLPTYIADPIADEWWDARRSYELLHVMLRIAARLDQLEVTGDHNRPLFAIQKPNGAEISLGDNHVNGTIKHVYTASDFDICTPAAPVESKLTTVDLANVAMGEGKPTLAEQGHRPLKYTYYCDPACAAEPLFVDGKSQGQLVSIPDTLVSFTRQDGYRFRTVEAADSQQVAETSPLDNAIARRVLVTDTIVDDAGLDAKVKLISDFLQGVVRTSADDGGRSFWIATALLLLCIWCWLLKTSYLRLRLSHLRPVTQADGT